MGTIVMTGATRGLGRIAAERLVAQPPQTHLVILARAGAGQALTAALRPSGATVSVIETDLLSLRSVAEAAAEITARLDNGELPPVQALALNAGAQFTNAHTVSPEGFEATFAINVLANHVLIHRLQDAMQAPARIVVTVSDSHFGDLRHNLGLIPAPQWHDPDTLARPKAFLQRGSVAAGRTAYSTSKLAAIHLIHEYARRLPVGVDVIGYNPGFVPGTGLARDADVLSRFAMRWILPALALTPIASTPSTAGSNLARLILGDLPAPTGSYVDRDHVASSSEESYDRERERHLFGTVERLAATHTT